MLKIVPEVDGRIAVLGRDCNAVPGRVADAVCGHDPGAYVTAVPGRDPLDPCDPMDLAVIGRIGIDAETGGPPGGRTGMDDAAGGPTGALGTTSRDEALGGAVVKDLCITGFESAALEAEEGRRDAFDAVPVPGREGEREILGVLLPEFIPRISGGSFGLRSSPIMIRLIRTMKSLFEDNSIRQ